jgi:pyruvate dehydrogenase E2 component (dihydrolipoyllysine-residue acetyltransferase)
MPSDVIMPALGMAQETGKVLRWLKAEGDAVQKGEPLLEIETDKVTVEVEAPATGTLAALSAAEGADVPVGQVIAVVLGDGEAASAAPSAARPRRPLASPKARRLAADRGVDLGALAGSGPNGAVVAADIPDTPAAAAPAASAVPAGSVWRVMAARTTESWQQVPHFYLRREVDASRLLSWREAARARHERVSVTDLLVKLAAEALVRHPGVNATWDDGSVRPLPEVNVGIAVAVDDGLVVPVVRGADRQSLAQVTSRRIELVEAARAGRLRPDDVTGGTFTISNLGMYGVDSFDAIVNAPQAAILAVGRILDRIVPLDGHPAVRPMLHLNVSFDHRVVDGARGAEFLQTLASLVEEPAGLVA